MKRLSHTSQKRLSTKGRVFLALALPLILLNAGVLLLRGSQEAAPAASQSLPSAAQDHSSAPDEVPENQTIRIKVEEVQVPFSVYDKKTSLVLDLKQDDFEIYEDGVKQDIRSFSAPANLPLRFGLLLDTSSSTRQRLKFEKEAAMQLGYYVLTKDKDKNHLGFLMQFDRTPEVIQDFTPDPDDLTTALDSLEASGGTALLDAIIESCQK